MQKKLQRSFFILLIVLAANITANIASPITVKTAPLKVVAVENNIEALGRTKAHAVVTITTSETV